MLKVALNAIKQINKQTISKLIIAENAGMCPKIPDGRVGTCDEKCSADRKCPDKKMCCSNGCGHDCMDPVKGTVW